MRETVQLHDGREVPSHSEEWRLECLARAVVRMPTTQDRRVWLEDYERRHGKPAADHLRGLVLALWDTRWQ